MKLHFPPFVLDICVNRFVNYVGEYSDVGSFGSLCLSAPRSYASTAASVTKLGRISFNDVLAKSAFSFIYTLVGVCAVHC